MIEEEARLQAIGVTDAFERTTISEDALVITPFHEIANRMRERARGTARHGSCGVGFGETVKDSLDLDESLVVRVRDLRDAEGLRQKFLRIQARKLDQLRKEGVLQVCSHMREAVQDIDDLFYPRVVEEYLFMLKPFLERARIVPDSYLGEILSRPGHVILEPAQGVLLDEWRGFDPYTTWSTCTLDNAETLLSEHDYDGKIRRLGIVRAYGTRHGAGPFVTEDAELSRRLPETHNENGEWQGSFRIGWFDAVAVRYAIRCVETGSGKKLDGLIVTCLDRLEDEPKWRICVRYDSMTDIPLGPFKDLEHQARLTERMFASKPVYEVSTRAATQEERVSEHVAAIERAIGLNVWITSHGPARDDKRLTSHWEP